MASEIIVQTIKGPTSGANANKIIVPSGQTLDASGGLTTPAGHVIQVVEEYVTNSVTYSSTSYSTTNLSVSLTPTSATSSVILISSVNMDYHTGTNATLAFFKNGVSLSEGSGQYDGHSYFNRISEGRIILQQPVYAVDSATGTTSAITYSLRLKTYTGAVDLRNDLGVGRIIAMEIAG
jgi:hypothetical protein